MNGMFDFFNDFGNYESRKIGRDEVNGLEVSTCDTSDEGYETAILDSEGVYPVERYSTKKAAIRGHKKWCNEAKSITKTI
jgi:hypothetical protein